MLKNARRANPLVPWRIVWLALALIALPGVIAMVVILVSTASTTSSGGTKPSVAPGPFGRQGSAACASTSRAPVNSRRSGAQDEVVPPGATAVLLCRYGPDGQRVRERSVTSAGIVSRLAEELNALPIAKGAYSCPFDDGESLTADFSYPSGPENPVSIGLSGCALVSNGHVHRIADGRAVVGRMEALVPWLGTIEGRLEICGGPVSGRCRATTGFASCGPSGCVRADQVAIMHPSGQRYPDVKLRRGRFRVSLEPGRYRLALVAHGRRVRGRAVALAYVRVRLGRTTRMSFRLSAP